MTGLAEHENNTPLPEPDELTAGTSRPDTIIVVDDHLDAAESYAQLLTAFGYQVSVAQDALQALSLIARVKPTVVILDIGLPVMDGYELGRRIRDEFGSGAPRLIAVTGRGLDEDRARSRELGFAAHLVKPIEAKTLITAIQGKRAPLRRVPKP